MMAIGIRGVNFNRSASSALLPARVPGCIILGGGMTVKSSDDFKTKYGPWALVAGASEGLGAALAQEIGSRGLNLVLIARRSGPLEATAARLRDACKVQVRTIAADLAEQATLILIEKETAGLEIGLLAYDAALAYTGPFFKNELSEYTRMLDVNCRASVSLMYVLGGRMAQRHRGGIIVVSSLAAFQGSPLVAVYGATKSFLVSIAEALGDELRPAGVDVTVCCPAVVKTPNFLNDGHNPNGPTPLSMEPAEVAREAVAGLGRKRIVIPGAMGKLAHFMMGRLMPRGLTVSMMGRSTRAMYGEKLK
jgi:short-subunit dehydrogenase